MIAPNQSKSENVYQLRISLQHIKPEIWRTVLVGSETTLEELHGIIQTVMPWSNSHLHVFIIGKKRYSMPDPDDGFSDEPALDEAEYTVGKVLGKKTKTFKYDYDFGDYWEHQITVEEVRWRTTEDTLPFCTGGEHAAPPDDSGGPFGYEEKLEAIADPKHEEHEFIKEWMPEGFDPTRFDLDGVNKNLANGLWSDLESLTDDY